MINVAMDGYVYAMAGASDMKARRDALNHFYYPDVMVTCNPEDVRF
jgi:hypothetical protein